MVHIKLFYLLKHNYTKTTKPKDTSHIKNYANIYI